MSTQNIFFFLTNQALKKLNTNNNSISLVAMFEDHEAKNIILLKSFLNDLGFKVSLEKLSIQQILDNLGIVTVAESHNYKLQLFTCLFIVNHNASSNYSFKHSTGNNNNQLPPSHDNEVFWLKCQYHIPTIIIWQERDKPARKDFLKEVRRLYSCLNRYGFTYNISKNIKSGAITIFYSLPNCIRNGLQRLIIIEQTSCYKDIVEYEVQFIINHIYAIKAVILEDFADCVGIHHDDWPGNRYDKSGNIDEGYQIQSAIKTLSNLAV